MIMNNPTQLRILNASHEQEAGSVIKECHTTGFSSLVSGSQEIIKFLSRFYRFRVSSMRSLVAGKKSMQQQDEHQQPCSPDSALYARYAASIFAYARLHTDSWQDAEDLTLEVFLAALEHENLSWLSDKQQFVWLRRVAHNKLVDNYRHSTRPALISLEQVVETVYRDEGLTPEGLAIRREELERLYKAVEKLPLLQQQVLQLRYEDSLRFADIAILLDKREEAVRKLYSRTLTRLRMLYEQQEGG